MLIMCNPQSANTQHTTHRKGKIDAKANCNHIIDLRGFVPGEGVGGGILPYKRLLGMCRWMGSHFHDWIDYNGVAFSIEFTRMGSHIFCFLG